jgi:hypothetical protein
MLVLFTLGLGMFIGAQVAGKVEAQHTTAARQGAVGAGGGQDGERDRETAKIATASAAEKTALKAKVKALDADVPPNFAMMNWRRSSGNRLWAKPAAFAGRSWCSSSSCSVPRRGGEGGA